MTTYLLNAGTLEQLLANTHLSGGTVNAIDYALFESGMYPTGKKLLEAQVNHGSGMETVSVGNSTGLFIELGSNVQDTISFSSGSDHGHGWGGGHGKDHDHDHDHDDKHHGYDTLKSAQHSKGGGLSGHVIVAGDGNNVSIFDKGTGHDTLIAGYKDNFSVHQTLSAGSGDKMLLGGLYRNVYDTLNGGSGNDTLQVYSGHNVLNAGSGHDTLFGGSGSDTMNLGGKGSHDLVYSGSGSESINAATGGHDTIDGFSQSKTQVYIDSDGKSVQIQSHGVYDVYSYGEGHSSTTIDVLHGSATVHIIS
jgi:Ca2+-binding RTX toxin-like protein